MVDDLRVQEYGAWVSSIHRTSAKGADADKGNNGNERSPKIRTTFHLPAGLASKLRDAVYWTLGLTLAGLAEDTLRNALAGLEKKRGEPFPRREKDLKGGRPVGS